MPFAKMIFRDNVTFKLIGVNQQVLPSDTFVLGTKLVIGWGIRENSPMILRPTQEIEEYTESFLLDVIRKLHTGMRGQDSDGNTFDISVCKIEIIKRETLMLTEEQAKELNLFVHEL